MHELDRLATIIVRSGLSRRQFAMRVLGRSESAVNQWFQKGTVPNDVTRRWIRSVESVIARDGRIFVELIEYAPTRRYPRVTRRREQEENPSSR